MEKNDLYLTFDDMNWPDPFDEKFEDLLEKMRFSTPSKNDMYFIANVMKAYRALINAEGSEREKIAVKIKDYYK